jgi:hypothetical protein
MCCAESHDWNHLSDIFSAFCLKPSFLSNCPPPASRLPPVTSRLASRLSLIRMNVAPFSYRQFKPIFSNNEISPRKLHLAKGAPPQLSQETQVAQRLINSLFPTSKTVASFHVPSPVTMGTPIWIHPTMGAFYELFRDVMAT